MKVPSSSQSRQSAAPAPGRASITAIMVEFDAASGGRPVGQCAQTNASYPPPHCDLKQHQQYQGQPFAYPNNRQEPRPGSDRRSPADDREERFFARLSNVLAERDERLRKELDERDSRLRKEMDERAHELRRALDERNQNWRQQAQLMVNPTAQPPYGLCSPCQQTYGYNAARTPYEGQLAHMHPEGMHANLVGVYESDLLRQQMPNTQQRQQMLSFSPPYYRY